MAWPDGVPPTVNPDRPSAARMYDFYLGGAHNFAVDREAAARAIAAMPITVAGARANRAFLQRAVRYLVNAGIRQFIDLGSGIPTSGNVHQVAQELAPDARVAYVDMDAVAVVHSRSLLTGNHGAVIVHGDLRDVGAVLGSAVLRRMIDLSEPVGLLMVAVLHFVPDCDGLTEILARYRDALAPGSYLVLSHMSTTGQPAQFLERFLAVYASTPNPLVLRPRAEIACLFGDFELVDPGLVTVPLWRPDGLNHTEHPQLIPGFAGVGRKVSG